LVLNFENGVVTLPEFGGFDLPDLREICKTAFLLKLALGSQLGLASSAWRHALQFHFSFSPLP
jgi:hypothetical protein